MPENLDVMQDLLAKFEPCSSSLYLRILSANLLLVVRSLTITSVVSVKGLILQLHERY